MVDGYMAQQVTFEDLFTIYPNRNSELRSVARTTYEFGKTIAQEPSAALSSGLDEHAIARQRSYLDYALAMIDAIAAKPIPDLPGSHPVMFPVNMSVKYDFFTTDLNGEAVAINEQTGLIAEQWMIMSVELVKSQSAALAGSLVNYDHKRAVNNIGVMRKLLDEMEARGIMDLPETAEPGSELGKTGTTN